MVKWDIKSPLHSYEIRNRTDNFSWLRSRSSEERSQFYGQLGEMLVSLPVLGVACVIDRQGYNKKYREKYGNRRWSVCKTAFNIVVERAAKFAMIDGRRLRVYYERSDKKHERLIENYYSSMRSEGMPFDPVGSEKYQPANKTSLQRVLFECRKKHKSSPPMQIADLYLFPICVGGYDDKYAPYDALKSNERLIDCVIDPASNLGVKYSCFDG